MVTQRTTLMSISFFAIILARKAPEYVQLLWTGVSVPYSEIKMGLIIVITMYLISYVMRWFAENEIDVYKKASTLETYCVDARNDIKTIIRYSNIETELAENGVTIMPKELERFQNFNAYIGGLKQEMEKATNFRSRLKLLQHNLFTLVVPIAIPGFALNFLFRS